MADSRAMPSATVNIDPKAAAIAPPTPPYKGSILMIDYIFPPLAGAATRRTLGLVQHFPDFGWAPIVLTVSKGDYHSYDLSLLQRVPNAVNVQRTASLEPIRFARKVLGRAVDPWASPNGRSRGGGLPWRGPQWANKAAKSIVFPDQRIGWLPFAVARALSLRHVRPFDIIYSTGNGSVTNHLIALVLKRMLNKPWVADFQDPWVDVEFCSPGLRRTVGEHIENHIFHAADHATFATEPLRVAFQRKYALDPEKLTTILLGFDPDEFRDIEPVKRSSKFTIMHFGSFWSFYAARSPVSFLQALGRCARENRSFAQDVEVQFFGTFDAKTLTDTLVLVDQLGLNDTVRLHGVVPYKQGVQYLLGSDVLLLVTSPGYDGSNLIPTKFFDYLGAGRPILALAPDGAVAQVMRQARAGIVAHPSDVGAIESAILSLYREWKNGELGVSINGEVISKWTGREIARQFSTILGDVLGQRA